MKAGLMEIGDVFAVNKSDREGADRLVKELESMLDLKQDKTWRPPVIKTSAVSGDGVAAVLEALEGHRGLPPEATRERRLRALRERVLDIGRKQLQQAVPEGSPGLDDLVREVAARRMSPADAASRLTGVHEGRTHG